MLRLYCVIKIGVAVIKTVEKGATKTRRVYSMGEL